MTQNTVRGTTETEAIDTVEALMLDHFRTRPFHNLALLFGPEFDDVPGGTCSDKTLSFIADAQSAGIDAHLHSGRIGGKEIHRLARVHIGDRTFYADVGNGWPSLRLLPADRAIAFACFGMRYRTEVSQDRVTVFQERDGKERVQVEIIQRPRPEADILRDIAQRFSSGIEYPFTTAPRFSQVVGERFAFLRGTRLEIYAEDDVECTAGISATDLPEIVHTVFGHRIAKVDASAR